MAAVRSAFAGRTLSFSPEGERALANLLHSGEGELKNDLSIDEGDAVVLAHCGITCKIARELALRHFLQAMGN